MKKLAFLLVFFWIGCSSDPPPGSSNSTSESTKEVKEKPPEAEIPIQPEMDDKIVNTQSFQKSFTRKFEWKRSDRLDPVDVTITVDNSSEKITLLTPGDSKPNSYNTLKIQGLNTSLFGQNDENFSASFNCSKQPLGVWNEEVENIVVTVQVVNGKLEFFQMDTREGLWIFYPDLPKTVNKMPVREGRHTSCPYGECHRVKPRETIDIIAARYNLTRSELYDLNPQLNGSTSIWVDEFLIIQR